MNLCDSCKKSPACPVAAFYRDEGRAIRECAVADVIDSIAAKDAALRHLRISQLRRMADACRDLEGRAQLNASTCSNGEWWRYHGRKPAIAARVASFRCACLAEIERLRALS